MEIYCALLENLNLQEIEQSFGSYVETIEGCPSYYEAYIGLLYQIVVKNKNLVNIKVKGNNLHWYLMNIARISLKDYWKDWMYDSNENIQLDNFILDHWILFNDSTHNYYYSNGAYQLFGVTNILLRELLKLSIE
jgi:hypothetical protein